MQFQAFFGTFTTAMQPATVVDVTSIVAAKFRGTTSKVIIPAATNFSTLFTDPAPGKKKFLQLVSAERRINILEDNYALPLEIDLADATKKLHIVYNLFIDPASNWQAIISGQLLQLKSYGILDEAQLYIPVTDIYNITEQVTALLAELVPQAIVTTSAINQFEYPGISLAYSLAQQHPTDVILYFHSKGMSHGMHSRSLEDIGLLMATFKHWRRNLEAFQNDTIAKIGVFPAIGDMDPTKPDGDLTRPDIAGGWVWFNFWYAKASYLLRCDEPRVEANRYLYERWLATSKSSTVQQPDCHSLRNNGAAQPRRLEKYLFQKKPRPYFTATEAIAELSRLLSENVLNRDMYSI